MGIKWTKENVIECISQDKLPSELMNPMPAMNQNGGMDLNILKQRIMQSAGKPVQSPQMTMRSPTNGINPQGLVNG